VDLIDSRDGSVAAVAKGNFCTIVFIRGVSTYKKREEKRPGIFLGEVWNTDASVANFVSIFIASWICLLDRNAAPQYF